MAQEAFFLSPRRTGVGSRMWEGVCKLPLYFLFSFPRKEIVPIDSRLIIGFNPNVFPVSFASQSCFLFISTALLIGGKLRKIAINI